MEGRVKGWIGGRRGTHCQTSGVGGGIQGFKKALDVDSGQRFKPLGDWHSCHSTVGQVRGSAHRGACSGLYICILWPWVVVLIMWQLGRLIVDKQQDYEGLCGSKGSTGWERPVICEAERKLVRAGWSCLFNSVPKEMKALCTGLLEISSQKIVDILERPISLRLIVFILKEENTRRKETFA